MGRGKNYREANLISHSVCYCFFAQWSSVVFAESQFIEALSNHVQQLLSFIKLCVNNYM